MRQTTINLYKFDELKKEIQQKVIEKNRDINTDFPGWEDWVLEDWYSKLKELGYEDTKIYYSGFGSQGDGACFIANINLEKYIGVHKLKTKCRSVLKLVEEDYINGTITHDGGYYFAVSTDVTIIYHGYSEKVDSQLAELEKSIKAERETIGNKIYKELENAYDELTSDEAIAETLRSNEYEFNSDGEMMDL